MTEQEIKDLREYLKDWYLAIKNGRGIENAYAWLRGYVS